MFGRTSIRFLVSNALSLLGNSIAAVALPLILLATTGDALAAGTLALICAVPQMAIGIVGGAALDRFNRRTISIASDLVSAASIALIPIVDMIWGLNFWWFVALGLLGAVGDIPGMTARDALLPAVTKHDDVDLQRFMGLSQSLDSLVTIVGPAFGGAVHRPGRRRAVAVVHGRPLVLGSACHRHHPALRGRGAIGCPCERRRRDRAAGASCHRPLARCAPASACCSAPTAC